MLSGIQMAVMFMVAVACILYCQAAAKYFSKKESIPGILFTLGSAAFLVMLFAIYSRFTLQG